MLRAVDTNQRLLEITICRIVGSFMSFDITGMSLTFYSIIENIHWKCDYNISLVNQFISNFTRKKVHKHFIELLHSRGMFVLTKLTLRARRTIMQTTPSRVSQSFVSPMCANTIRQTCRNFPAVKSIPKISFTWLVAMMMAPAEVNPTETGPEMKSIKKPCWRKNMQTFWIIHVPRINLFRFDNIETLAIRKRAVFSCPLNIEFSNFSRCPSGLETHVWCDAYFPCI